tara:strand:- start:1037 stop:1990 length:954 start_codon:yes stop_codon:yes gene_type:complete
MRVSKKSLSNIATICSAITFSIFILILFTVTVSNDVGQYDLIFFAIKNSGSLRDAIFSLRYEPGFTAIYYSLSLLFSDSRAAFIALGSLSIALKYLILKNNLRFIFLSWFSYVVIFLPSLEASQIRTAIASTIILYSICLPKEKYNYIYNGIAASLMHLVGVLIFAFQLIRKPLVAVLMISVAAVIFNFFFQLLQQYIPVLYYYRSNQFGMSINLLSTTYLAQSLIAVCCVLNWNLLDFKQKKGAFLIIVGTILFFLLSDFPSIVHRVREISMLGVFPLLFSQKLRVTLPSVIIYLSFLYYLLYHLFFLLDEIIKYI